MSKCACHKQIVWFFDKPTIIVCEQCEKTFHFTDKRCDECKGKLTEFTREQREGEY